MRTLFAILLLVATSYSAPKNENVLTFGDQNLFINLKETEKLPIDNIEVIEPKKYYSNT